MVDLNLNNITLPPKPFKLGTTSFIVPDHIIPNVKKLGPFFDEIELLVFESHPKEILPLKDDIKQLLYLSQKHDLNFNIHLPVDVSITHKSTKNRLKAKDAILKVIELFTPLKPTTYTLHLDMPKDININIKNSIADPYLIKKYPDLIKKYPDLIKKWRARVRDGLESLLLQVPNPEIISIETLDYPFDFVESFIEEFNLSVCLDAGHQIKYGYNLLQTFEKYRSKISIIHLHGVDFSKLKIQDHTSLDKLPEQYQNEVKTILNNYSGVVSLEVFNLENLNRSLIFLSKFFKDIKPVKI